MKYTTENDIERYCLQLLEHLGYTCIHQTAPTGRSHSAKRAKDIYDGQPGLNRASYQDVILKDRLQARIIALILRENKL